MDDALYTISALIAVLNRAFVPYLPATLVYVDAALRNHEHVSVCVMRASSYKRPACEQACTAAIGVVVDLSRAFERDIASSLDGLMVAMGGILQDTDMDRSVHPTVLSAFGDVALAVGEGVFARYADTVLSILLQVNIRAHVQTILCFVIRHRKHRLKTMKTMSKLTT
jgi:importin subunit beta-1